MRGDSKIALAFIALGIAPALIKKSKPLARYLGDQLIRAGEYLQHDSEEPDTRVAPKAAVAAPPYVEASSRAADQEPKEIETVEELYQTTANVASDPTPEAAGDEIIEGENPKKSD